MLHPVNGSAFQAFVSDLYPTLNPSYASINLAAQRAPVNVHGEGLFHQSRHAMVLPKHRHHDSWKTCEVDGLVTIGAIPLDELRVLEKAVRTRPGGGAMDVCMALDNLPRLPTHLWFQAMRHCPVDRLPPYLEQVHRLLMLSCVPEPMHGYRALAEGWARVHSYQVQPLRSNSDDNSAAFERALVLFGESAPLFSTAPEVHADEDHHEFIRRTALAHLLISLCNAASARIKTSFFAVAVPRLKRLLHGLVPTNDLLHVLFEFFIKNNDKVLVENTPRGRRDFRLRYFAEAWMAIFDHRGTEVLIPFMGVLSSRWSRASCVKFYLEDWQAMFHVLQKAGALGAPDFILRVMRRFSMGTMACKLIQAYLDTPRLFKHRLPVDVVRDLIDYVCIALNGGGWVEPALQHRWLEAMASAIRMTDAAALIGERLSLEGALRPFGLTVDEVMTARGSPKAQRRHVARD